MSDREHRDEMPATDGQPALPDDEAGSAADAAGDAGPAADASEDAAHVDAIEEDPEVVEIKAPLTGDAPPQRSKAAQFGTAMGAAMLGFEQAMRSQPPAQILAGEHQKPRGLSGEDDGLVLEFPDDPVDAAPSPEDEAEDERSPSGR